MNAVNYYTRWCWLDDLLSKMERGEEMLLARRLEREAVYATDVIVVAAVVGVVVAIVIRAAAVAAAVVALTATVPENCCYNTIF